MTYTPLKKDKSSIVISLILFLCAAVSVIFDALGVGYSLILQLITVVTAVSAIFITARYTLTGFTYKLTSDDDLDRLPGFIVVKTQGNQKKTVVNLSIENAIAIVPKSPIKNIVKRYGKLIRRLNYCVNMFPDASYFYIFEYNGGINIIEFESSPEFLETFKFMIGQR